MKRTYSDGGIVERNGRRYRINFEHDSDTGAPWENEDGHGPVSDWTTRDKRSGEWVLFSDGSSKQFYDYQAAMKQAKAEGWGLTEAAKATLAVKLNKPILTLTRGEITAESVRLDFEHLRGWCNDDWHYCGVIVTDITDDEYAGNDYAHALWGINDDDEEYLASVADEFIGQQERAQAINNRFSDAMQCGI